MWVIKQLFTPSTSTAESLHKPSRVQSAKPATSSNPFSSDFTTPAETSNVSRENKENILTEKNSVTPSSSNKKSSNYIGSDFFQDIINDLLHSVPDKIDVDKTGVYFLK